MNWESSSKPELRLARKADFVGEIASPDLAISGIFYPTAFKIEPNYQHELVLLYPASW